MKYLLVMTDSNNVINFRKSFIKFLKAREHSVVIIAQDDKRQKEIEDLGVVFYCVEQNNRGMNPLSMFVYRKKIKAIMKNEKPDVVCTFQLKPNVFGIPAAKAIGCTKIYGMVEGLGDVYINDTFKWKCIRFAVNRLYKHAFKRANKIFFLNEDDKKEFLTRRLLKSNKSVITNGIGVDLEHFSFKPMTKHNKVLMVARMLKTKGVFDYCKAARIVKKKYPDVEFDYVGGEGSLKYDNVKDYMDDGTINYLGVTNDVRPYLENAAIVVLPSYREGMPVSIMEAEAMGRVIITTNCAGCRQTVIDGYNGFLVEKEDYASIADKIMWCIENPQTVEDMGRNARLFAENNFDSERINQFIYEVINESTAPIVVE